MQRIKQATILLVVALLDFSFSEIESSVDLPPWNDSCTGLIQDIQYELGTKRGSHTNLLCETESGEMYSVDVSRTWVEEQILDGKLVSGETEVNFPSGSVVDNDHGAIKMADVPVLSTAQDTSLRKLDSVEGQLSVLVVKVIASNSSTSKSIDDLTNSVFGNGPNDPDGATFKSQYNECSHFKLNFVEAQDLVGLSTKISKGGTTISVNINTSQGDSVMRNAITKELNSQFGVRKPSDLADHVMYCLPPGTMSGVAYATVNSWNSVYNDDWCMKLSAQVHEIGHNLGLAHSNENDPYEDQSGMMGYSYREDNSPRMCFNAAKSWQLGWYNNRHKTLSTSNPSYFGRLASIVDDPNADGPPMLIKIDNPSGKEYFINFNLKAGFNSGTREGENKVLIVKAGPGYSESNLKAKLNIGETYVVRNFDRKGKDLSVEVVSIMKADKIALIRICLGTCENDVSDAPTVTRIPSPGFSSNEPTVSPSRIYSNEPTSSPSQSRIPYDDLCEDSNARVCKWVRKDQSRCTYMSDICPRTCGDCDPNLNPPSPSPSVSKSTVSPTKDSSKGNACYDTDRTIPVLNQSKERYCMWLDGDLSRCQWTSSTDSSKNLSDYCPVTCGLDCECYDEDFLRYQSAGKIREVSCEWVASNGLCSSNKGRSYCPIACGLC